MWYMANRSTNFLHTDSVRILRVSAFTFTIQRFTNNRILDILIYMISSNANNKSINVAVIYTAHSHAAYSKKSLMAKYSQNKILLQLYTEKTDG